MSLEDKIKWDKKYKEKQKLLEPREPSLFVKKYCQAAGGREALDLACGVGRNALFLEDRGFRVDAVDISEVALDTLKSRSKGTINIIKADLDTFTPSKSYNLIIKCNFLDRALIERTKSSLKSGGIYIVETYIEDKANEKKESNPAFLLKKDELLKIFKDGFEVLEYKTFWNESYELYKMRKAVIAVRKK
jgi:SAM-dependent methyltransferase